MSNVYIPMSNQKPKDYYLMPESDLKLQDNTQTLVQQQNQIDKDVASQSADKAALKDTVQGAAMAASGGGGLSSALVGGGVSNMLSTGTIGVGSGGAVLAGSALEYLKQQNQNRTKRDEEDRNAFLTTQQNKLAAMQSLIGLSRGLGVGA